jgi:hypothetical protein
MAAATPPVPPPMTNTSVLYAFLKESGLFSTEFIEKSPKTAKNKKDKVSFMD